MDETRGAVIGVPVAGVPFIGASHRGMTKGPDASSSRTIGSRPCSCSCAAKGSSAQTKEGGAPCGAPPHHVEFRRCLTLPHPPECSTISAVGLSYRVRDGTGRFPHAKTTGNLTPTTRSRVGGETSWSWFPWTNHYSLNPTTPTRGGGTITAHHPTSTPAPAVPVQSPSGGWGLLMVNHIVDASTTHVP